MILTCPNCATRFFADDEAIGPSGRRVKCDVCGTVWTGRVSLVSKPIPEVSAKPPAEEWSARLSTGSTILPDDVSASSPLFVERGSTKRDVNGKGAGRPWALGLVVLFFVVVAGMLVFQPAIENAFPGAVTLYHAIGLKGAASRA